MRRTLCTLATVGLGLSLILGSTTVASAAAPAPVTVTTAQCTAAGGTVGSKTVPGGSPDEVEACVGGTDDGLLLNDNPAPAPAPTPTPAPAPAPVTVTTAQCTAAGGTVGSKTVPGGSPDEVEVCVGGTDDGIPVQG